LSNLNGLIKQIDIKKSIRQEEIQLYQISATLKVDIIKLDLETRKILQRF
jgi:hypothetical protein